MQYLWKGKGLLPYKQIYIVFKRLFFAQNKNNQDSNSSNKNYISQGWQLNADSEPSDCRTVKDGLLSDLKSQLRLGMTAHAFNPSIEEAEAGRL